MAAKIIVTNDGLPQTKRMQASLSELEGVLKFLRTLPSMSVVNVRDTMVAMRDGADAGAGNTTNYQNNMDEFGYVSTTVARTSFLEFDASAGKLTDPESATVAQLIGALAQLVAWHRR